MTRMKCESSHTFLWSSSKNKEYLVNDRVQHGLICSVMLPSHYTKFVDGAGVAKRTKEKQNKFFNSYENHIQIEYNKSTKTALLEESASYNDDKFGEIDIRRCAVKIALKKVASGKNVGTATSERKTWSFQLSDKAEPVSTHIHWAIRNCINDPEKLKLSILNVVDHYKNRHLSCDPSSRCRYDEIYEPSRTVLTDPVAEKLLLGVLLNSNISKYPKDYVLGKNTFYVESFNNVINIYQDKRIAFGDKQYNARLNLAVCQWNENVDRDFKSTKS
ncbi:unnamed protein product [Mytilus coruscus]|uniref:Uncharacterized protein n=1 Tax=Mytilus coruscus TaxID=42192 RepID=A0A6J8EPG0_MYTCO|nr:unnamed protein product [Mytilus coruscus]